MVDYYATLGVQRYASPEDIKRAYHRVALKWHPDKNPENKEEAEQKFKEVAEAYEVLSNGEKRSMYDKYGKEGLNGEGGSRLDDEREYSFTFCKADDVFKEFLGKRDPFSFHFFEDPLEDLLRSSRNSKGSSRRGAGSHSYDHPSVFARLSSYDPEYSSYVSLGYKDLTSFSSLAFDETGVGNYFPMTPSGKFVNGRHINIKNAFENLHLREAEDDGGLRSFLENSMSEEEGFAEKCNWRRHFNNYSPNYYSPPNIPQYTLVENNEQGTPWVASKKDPSIFSAGFKEGGRRKKKHREGQKKKSNKRNS
ncbi:dnaJ homolog subfamily B member 7 [Psammomys obesus]|uniref:dnaJ homolog subfamily B member 7 n=1 Tax=Psammomys obesus TaxID=48139 RepID=UPI002453557F|nr:dnaJ homolog subfamily B member 7 [Psammomys obesus]